MLWGSKILNLIQAIFGKSAFVVKKEEAEFLEVFRTAYFGALQDVKGTEDVKELGQHAQVYVLAMVAICPAARVNDKKVKSFCLNKQGSVECEPRQSSSPHMARFDKSGYDQTDVLNVRVGYGTALKEVVRDCKACVEERMKHGRLKRGLEGAGIAFTIDQKTVTEPKPSKLEDLIKKGYIKYEAPDPSKPDLMEYRVVPEEDPWFYVFLVSVYNRAIRGKWDSVPCDREKRPRVLVHLNVFVFLWHFYSGLLCVMEDLEADDQANQIEQAEADAIRRAIAKPQAQVEAGPGAPPSPPHSISSSSSQDTHTTQESEETMAGIAPGTPVARCMFSDKGRPNELRKFEGTFVLLAPPEQTGGFQVYGRPRDLFTQDGPRVFSEVGRVEERPETYAGAAGREGRATSTGLRVGRLAVADAVAEVFKPGGPMGTVEWERKEAWLKFDADGNLVDTSERLTTEQLAVVDAEFKKEGARQKRYLSSDFDEDGWLVKIHRAVADKQGGDCATVLGKAHDRDEGPGNAKCLNCLTCGDLTALLMAEYYWRRPSVTMPRLSSYRLPIKWDLPRSQIQHAIGDVILEEHIYKFLRPKMRQEAPSSDEGEEYAEYYHLQHFVTLINLLGQGGDIIKGGHDFFQMLVDVSLYDVAEQHRPSLAFACLWYSTAVTLTGNQVLVYITPSSSLPMTLVLRVYYRVDRDWDQLHAYLHLTEDKKGLRVDMAPIKDLLGEDRITSHEALTVLDGSDITQDDVDWGDLRAVVAFFSTGHPFVGVRERSEVLTQTRRTMAKYADKDRKIRCRHRTGSHSSRQLETGGGEDRL